MGTTVQDLQDLGFTEGEATTLVNQGQADQIAESVRSSTPTESAPAAEVSTPPKASAPEAAPRPASTTLPPSEEAEETVDDPVAPKKKTTPRKAGPSAAFKPGPAKVQPSPLKKDPDVSKFTKDGRINIDDALKGGVSAKALKDLGVSSKDIASANARVAAAAKASEFMTGNQINVDEALKGGVSTETLKTLGVTSKDITGAAARIDAAAKASKFMSGNKINVDDALKGGISQKTLKTLGVSGRDITRALARLNASDTNKTAVDNAFKRVRSKAPDQATRAALDRNDPVNLNALRAAGVSERDLKTIGFDTKSGPPVSVPTPMVRAVPPVGEKFPVPDWLLKEASTSRGASEAAGLASGMSLNAAVGNNAIRAAAFKSLVKGVETGDATVAEARVIAAEIKGTRPLGSLRDVGYLVPGFGTFLSYQDAQRSGFNPLETGFFALSAALDILIFAVPLKAGGVKIVRIPVSSATKITPARVRAQLRKPVEFTSRQVTVIRDQLTKPIVKVKRSIDAKLTKTDPAAVKQKELVTEVNRRGDRPRAGDVRLPSDKPGQRFGRELTGELGGPDTAFITGAQGEASERTVLIIRPQGKPPFPVLGESPLWKIEPGSGPKPSGFTWTPDKFDGYLESLRRVGTSPQQIDAVLKRAPATHPGTLPWERGGSSAVAERPASGLIQDYPIPTNLTLWEKPTTSANTAARRVRQAQLVFDNATVKLAALTIKVAAATTASARRQLSQTAVELQNVRIRAQAAALLQQATIQGVSVQKLTADTDGTVQWWEQPTTTQNVPASTFRTTTTRTTVQDLQKLGFSKSEATTLVKQGQADKVAAAVEAFNRESTASDSTAEPVTTGAPGTKTSTKTTTKTKPKAGTIPEPVSEPVTKPKDQTTKTTKTGTGTTTSVGTTTSTGSKAVPSAKTAGATKSLTKTATATKTAPAAATTVATRRPL